jgi:prenyltransferase beta subunit
MRRLYLPLVVGIVWLVPARGDVPEANKASVAYLRNLQADDGGFLPARPAEGDQKQARSSLRATSAALRALKYFGGTPRDREACARFVESCYDRESGGFVDHPGGKPDVTLTAIGLMAVVELKLPVEKYKGPAVRYLAEHARTFEEIRIAAAGLEAVEARPTQADDWLKQVASLRNADGSYGKGAGIARATGSAVVVVLRLGGEVSERGRVVQTLKAGQRADGGFGKEETTTSDLETTYRVVRAFIMLRQKPADVAACRAFVAKCRNADGGYGVAPGQPSTVGATYYAAIITHWLSD